MRITIEQDNGKVEILNDVTDMALVYCQLIPVAAEQGKARGELRLLPLAKTRSIFGEYPRELVKEYLFASEDLRAFLKDLGNGKRP